jgi:hypothetical protein
MSIDWPSVNCRSIEAIRKLTHSYAMFADQGAADEMAALFADDGVWDGRLAGHGLCKGRSEIRDIFAGFAHSAAAGHIRQAHLVGNHLFKTIDDNSAAATCHYIAQKWDGRSFQIEAGYYEDVYTRRQNWIFQSRILHTLVPSMVVEHQK